MDGTEYRKLKYVSFFLVTIFFFSLKIILGSVRIFWNFLFFESFVGNFLYSAIRWILWVREHAEKKMRKQKVERNNERVFSICPKLEKYVLSGQ